MSKPIQNLIDRFKDTLIDFPEVRYAGDLVLRQQAQQVSVKEGVALGKKLGEILLRYRESVGYGRGFAAPQVGENKAVFVTFVDKKLQIFINPKIVEKSKKTNFYRELCLSSGVMSADVERPEWIIMKWTDESGKQRKERVEGFLARLYQHEEAHLRGKLNLDEAAEGGIEFILFDPMEEKLRDKKKE